MFDDKFNFTRNNANINHDAQGRPKRHAQFLKAENVYYKKQ